MIDIRTDVPGLWCDDITFCQEECSWMNCPRNSKNIRDRTIPHSFSVEMPEDCPKREAKTRDLIEERASKTEFIEVPEWHIEDYVHVVRCKDCRHCTFSNGEQLADCMIKQGWFPVKPDWFCADGER